MKRKFIHIFLGLALFQSVISCDSSAISGRHFKNTAWKILKIESIPTSNEFGEIQCASEATLSDAGGIVFEKSNGKIAYINPQDSVKHQFEFFYSEAENEQGMIEVNIGEITLVFDPKETGKNEFSGYFEEINVCADVIRNTFYIQKYDLKADAK